MPQLVLVKDPNKVIRSGAGLDHQSDPLVAIQQELDQYQYVSLPGLPTFTGERLSYGSTDALYHQLT